MTGNARHWMILWLTGILLLLTTCEVSALTVAQQGNQLLIDGTPTALTFARGLRTPQELAAYHALGFNTLLITIDTPGTRVLKSLDPLLNEAEQLKMYLLVELANGAWSGDRYTDLNNPEYVQNATYYLDAVIPALQKRSNLVGWVISTVDEDRSASNVGSFVDHLRLKYGTIEAVNAAWSVRDEEGKVTASPRLTSFALLSVLKPEQMMQLAPNQAVREKMAEDLVVYQQAIAARDVDFQTFLRTQYPNLEQLSAAWKCQDKWQFPTWNDITVDKVLAREKARHESSTVSMLDLARYQALTPVTQIDWWAKEVAKRDADHLRFAGSQHAYRTLITLPHSMHGALTECYPGYAEADVESQNPHAVDIARRGNSFIVLAGVQAQNLGAQSVANAMYSDVIRGASGLCINDWPTLLAAIASGDPLSLASTVRASLGDIATRQLLGRVPSPTTAIVYSPYPSRRTGARAAYGYMAGFLSAGPDALFFQLRKGTCFGQFDYLAADDLATLPLSRYQTILLPSVLDLPDAAQDALLNYTKSGGTVVADIGIGTMQANKDYFSLTPKLMQLFNVNNAPRLERVKLNLEVSSPTTRFPSLTPGLRTTGVNNGYMIARAAKMMPLGGTQLLFNVIPRKGANQSSSVVSISTGTLPRLTPPTRPTPPKPLKPTATTGMFIYQHGNGTAVYAPFPLYQFWLPENHLFGQFHYDLFGYNANALLRRPIDLLPSLAELGTYADGSLLVWTKDNTRPEVEVRNPDRYAYAVEQGHCVLKPEETVLNYDTPGFHQAQRVPIMIAPVKFTVRFALTQATASTLDFDLGADDDDFASSPVTLAVAGGTYPIIPGSQHSLTIETQTGTQTTLAQADPNGQLIITIPARSHVRISNGLAATSGAEVTPEVVIDVKP